MKIGLIAVVLSVVAIACTATSPASREDPVVELVNYGIFHGLYGPPTLKEKTDTIPMESGLRYGVIYVIRGPIGYRLNVQQTWAFPTASTCETDEAVSTWSNVRTVEYNKRVYATRILKRSHRRHRDDCHYYVLSEEQEDNPRTISFN